MAIPGWVSRLMEVPKVAGGKGGTHQGLHSWRMTLGGVHARVHVRGEPDGTAIAIINASSAVRLTAPGAVMARGVLDDLDDTAIIKELRRRFAAPRPRLLADLAEVRAVLSKLATDPGDAFPIVDLTDGRSSLASSLSAPLEAWVEMAPLDGLIPRLDALWSAGIPHVTLIARPETPADDLVHAVERSEDLGMICGIRAPGAALPEATLRRCADAGLDCLQVPLLAQDAAAHDEILGAGDHAATLAALDTCGELELCAIAEVPLVAQTSDALMALAEHLIGRGIQTLALWALVAPEGDTTSGALPRAALYQLGEEAEEVSEAGNNHVLWAPPLLADARPLRAQLLDGPRSASDASIRVRSDGSVLPARSSEVAGVLGTTPWPEIWAHAAFRDLREELATEHLCAWCPDLALCSATCPGPPLGADA